MATFKITKKGINNFWHTYNNNSKVVNLSDFEVVLDYASQTFSISMPNGANVPNIAVAVADIIVLDETGANVNEIFANVEALRVRLVALGYTPYIISSGGGIQSIQEGTNITVDNTDPLNPIVSATGGGGSQTLAETLVLGNTTGGENIEISDGDGVFMDNGSRLIKGVTDAGTGGSKGIALKCSIDYEYKWEAGSLYVLEQNGLTIRETKYKFSFTPTVNDDSTKGFIIGSRWILDNGDVYLCTDATTATAVWELQSAGTVTSVGLTMPTAFSVANSPVTTSGTLDVTANGLASQYIRGDGQLATLPSGSSGGSSVNYYLNGSVNASVAPYKQMSNTAIIGTGTDFAITGNGLIAQFLTDVGNPNRIEIPGGAWNFEMFFSMSSGGGSPKFYVQLLKYDGATFTSIASSSTTPETISGGTPIDLYLTSLAVPTTPLLVTDRLAIRVYIVDNSGGRTATLHTEDSHLCEIITTFSGGVTSLNGLTANTQNLAVGTSGSDFNISSVTDIHTFNLPDASATKRGVITTGTQTIAGAKTFSSNISIPATGTPLILSVSSGGSVSGLDTVTYPSLTELELVKGVTGSAIQTQLDGKQPFAVPTTGAVISFATPQIYNTFTSPTALNITDNLVSPMAKIGVVQKIYHNNATEPTYPAGWKKLFGTYTNGVKNIIYCEWVEGSRVEYWIVKATV